MDPNIWERHRHQRDNATSTTRFGPRCIQWRVHWHFHSWVKKVLPRLKSSQSLIDHASQPSILQYARSQWWHDGDWLNRECTIQEPQPSCEKYRHSWGRKFSARMLIFSRWTLCLDKHCCRQSTFAVQHTNSIWKDRMENCSINKWVW